MKNKPIFVLLASLFIFSLLAVISVAAPQQTGGTMGALESIFGSIAGENFPEVYAKYDVFIDMVIYLIIFIGLTQWTLGKHVKFEKGGKALQIGIGIIFAVGLALWEKTAGFNIMSFGPVAFGILVAIMCFAAYVGMIEFGVHKGTAAALAYAAAFLAISGSGVFVWMAGKPGLGIVVALASLLFLLGIVWLGWKIIEKIISFTKGRKSAVSAETAGELSGQKGGRERKEEAEEEVTESFTAENIEKIKKVGEEIDSGADTSLKVLITKLKNEVRLDERKRLKEALEAEGDRIIKMIHQLKGNQKAIRRQTKTLRRQIPAEQLKEEESNVMSYCDNIIGELDEAVKKIEEFVKGIKEGQEVQTTSTLEVASNILKRKLPAQLGELLAMEQRIYAQLKGK